jgi:hypothetical protein
MLTHPLTGETVELFDPDLHTDACWKAVRCGRCGREYVCAPWDDYMTPAAELQWQGDGVCEPCLLRLARDMNLVK